MSTKLKNITFNDALEIVESLPDDQRESLVKIVKRRLIEKRRNRLAQSIKEAKEEYARGEIKKGTVDDLIREISK
ncbi:MAG: hypothetical protein COS84_02410 [Armatimonadetes bacterium CG07_land_8_20_14_0_80_40_9]|nr:MAG: hypothetical protein COS84_02410 [Armatimonadetes bacterium CG07_land_8_20_14_0_80_40_9]